MTRPIWYDNAETGAPTLNNAPGSLVEVLRACKVTGFNLKSVTNIVVASGVATATAAAHGYSSAYGKLLRIEGAPVAGLNGDVQPLTVDTNTFTYACPGVPDGTYSGTITARRAPLGWIEAHTGTNKAIFARSATEATMSMLRVVDTRAAPASASYAYVTMVEAATDVDTVTNEVPQSAVASTQYPYWSVGENTAAAKRWAIVGDHLGVYVMTENQSPLVYPGLHIYWFGDPYLIQDADAYGCLITGHAGENMSTVSSAIVSASPSSWNYWLGTLTAAINFQRNYSGLTVRDGAKIAGAGSWGGQGPVSPAKVPITGDFHLITATEIRAVMPGIYAPQAVRPFANWSIIEPPGLGKKLLVVEGNNGSSTGSKPQPLIDLTGPWRT